MSRIALACAVMLASLFTVSAQADAAGFKRYSYKPHVVHHTVRKLKAHRAQKRLRALRRFRHRYVLRHHRHAERYRIVRRYR